MSTASNPPAPQTTWADILRELDEPAPDIHPGVPIAFMVGWGAISTLALGSGMLTAGVILAIMIVPSSRK
jgi:ABC-type phosphate transport system permease subunit